MVRLPIAYCPPLDWFLLAQKHGHAELEASEHYQKGTVRNRCVIAGPNGKQMLSIPLEKGKSQQTPIREVRISYAENWQRDHWRSLKTAYNASPFFPHYEHIFIPFFEKKYQYLFDFNYELILTIFSILDNDINISYSQHYEVENKVLDGRSFFNKKGGGVPDFQAEYYPQVFEDKNGFLENLSVLDALFCKGSL